MTSVNSVHRKDIDERQHDEDKDGTLLGKPKPQGKAAKIELI